jgi:hypothetical integral membrane protein (TIGR02206 family)
MTGPARDLSPSAAWDVFVPYGGLHLAALGACALAVAGIAMAGRALRRTQRDAQEALLRRTFGVFGIAYWLTYNTWWNRHGLDLTGLPLHICDLSGLVAPLALITGWRWLRALLYFWTFTLTIQAFIQPALTLGPASAVFWWFWGAHTIILAAAVYDLAVLGFRPGWPDFARACVASALYLAVIIPLDLWLGANYGYVGNPPPGVPIPPFVEALGPWPLRALAIAALTVAGYGLLMLPWQRTKAREAA